MKPPLSRLAAPLALLAVLSLAATATAADPQKPGRSIRVQGNRFVDAAGQAVIYKGLCFSDPDKLDKVGRWNKRYFEAAREWGANIVRIPVHPVAWRERGSQAYLALLDQGVRWARETGLAVIIDWHVIGNLRTELFQDPIYDTTRKETLEFWRTVSKRYRDDPTVVFYEVLNEPTTFVGQLGRLAWPQWRDMIEEIVGVIRAHDPSSIVLVAGLDWGYELREVVANPVDAPAIGYVSHPYPQKRDEPWPPKWEADWGHVADKYPVFVTEFGFDRHGSVPFIGTPHYARVLLDYMAKKGMSWTVWCFDVDWGPTLIRDWSFTPTEQGEVWRAALLGRQLPKE
jgi:hypothetical protein